MRRSTVLSLPLQLEFPAQSLFTINEDLSALKQKTWRPDIQTDGIQHLDTYPNVT
jgi:hypothetical protein